MTEFGIVDIKPQVIPDPKDSGDKKDEPKLSPPPPVDDPFGRLSREAGTAPLGPPAWDGGKKEPAAPVAPVESDTSGDDKDKKPVIVTDKTPEQYWQSEADKRHRDINEILEAAGLEPVRKTEDVAERVQQAQALRQVIPIAQYLQTPGVVDAVEQVLSGSPQPGQAPGPSEPVGDKVELPKKPERPKEPAYFSAEESWSDPNSESHKYRKALEKFQDDTIEYQEKLLEAREQQMQKDSLQHRQTQDRQVANTQLVALGAKPEEIPRFWNFMGFLANKAQVGELWNFYRKVHAPSDKDIERDKKVKAMEAEKKRLAIPTPAGVEGVSTVVAPVPEGKSFMKGLIEGAERRNPFRHALKRE